MANHFLALLAAIAERPSAQVWAIPLLNDAERKWIEHVSAGSGKPLPADTLLHRLFEKQAQCRPEAVAICCGGLRVSYSEVNELANRVAQHLRSIGVGPETIVGLCALPSLDLVVGALGILKAGGAYVFLDPREDKDWLSFILADTRAPVVVTHRVAQVALAELSSIPALVLLEDVDGALSSSDNLLETVGPENLACVMYTTAPSARQPAGVLLSHANVARLLASTESYFNFGHEDVWALVHSFAVDLSVLEIWGALRLWGAPSRCASRDQSSIPGAHCAISQASALPSSLRRFRVPSGECGRCSLRPTHADSATPHYSRRRSR